MNSFPILILTKRRSGSTTVATFLSRVTPGEAIAHEPFNADRKFGKDLVELSRSGDSVTLGKEVRRIMKSRPSLKHCFDNLPTILTKEVIRAAVHNDYKIVVLTRRDTVARLLSLAIAKSTGAWGSKAAAEIYPEIIAGKRQPAQINLDQIKKLYFDEFYRTGLVLSQLKHSSVQLKWILAEDLFHDKKSTKQKARDLAAWFGCEVAPEDPSLELFSSDRDQRSADMGPYIPNYSEAKALLENFCDF